MSNKTFCIFTAQYLPNLGGVERYAYNTAQELLAQGNKVVIVTSLKKSLCVYEKQGDLEIFRVPSIQLINGRMPITIKNRTTQEVLDIISKKKLDGIIINTNLYNLSVIAAKYAKKKKTPALVIIHGTGHVQLENRILNYLSNQYEHVITKLIKKYVNEFYGVSMECNNWLHHYGINAKGVLYNSVDFEQINRLLLPADTTVCNQVDYSDEDIIITFTGRLIESKGIIKLIDAYKKVRKNNSHVKLCIAGEGELSEYIANIGEDGIFYLGALSFDEVIQLLKISTFFCLPTDYPEGLPTSVLEAIASKVYVITSQKGGSKEIIINDSYGSILKENTSVEIATCLRFLINNPDIRNSVVENVYDRASKQFTWKHTSRKIIEALESQN